MPQRCCRAFHRVEQTENFHQLLLLPDLRVHSRSCSSPHNVIDGIGTNQTVQGFYHKLQQAV